MDDQAAAREKFQFYLSSIKRKNMKCIRCNNLLFQFYLSSIKSIINVRFKLSIKSFNSTLVQLKGPRSEIDLEKHPCFNSTLVQLKVSALTVRNDKSSVSILP